MPIIPEGPPSPEAMKRSKVPEEVKMLMDSVHLTEARDAIENYLDETLLYAEKFKERKATGEEISDDELQEMKQGISSVLDTLNQFKDKPEVRDAILGILWYGISLQQP